MCFEKQLFALYDSGDPQMGHPQVLEYRISWSRIVASTKEACVLSDNNGTGSAIAWSRAEPLQYSEWTSGILAANRFDIQTGSIEQALHLFLEGWRFPHAWTGQWPDRNFVFPGQSWKLWGRKCFLEIVSRNTGFLSFHPWTRRWDCLDCTFVCFFSKASLY